MNKEFLLLITELSKPQVTNTLTTNALLEHYAENMALLRKCDKSIIMNEINDIKQKLKPQFEADLRSLVEESFAKFKGKSDSE